MLQMITANASPQNLNYAEILTSEKIQEMSAICRRCKESPESFYFKEETPLTLRLFLLIRN